MRGHDWKIGNRNWGWDYKDGMLRMLFLLIKLNWKTIVGGFVPTCILFFTKSRRLFNDLSERERKKITAIGVGAIGSQVFMNLIRSGYGKWIINQ